MNFLAVATAPFWLPKRFRCCLSAVPALNSFLAAASKEGPFGANDGLFETKKGLFGAKKGLFGAVRLSQIMI